MSEVREGVLEFWRQYEGQAPARHGTGEGAAGGFPPGTGTAAPTAARFPRELPHICTVQRKGCFENEPRNGVGFTLSAGHSVICLKGHGVGRYGGGEKGIVTVWSRRSRAEAMKQLCAIDWDSRTILHVTGTWPGSYFPGSGAEAHSKMRAFWVAWGRRFGKYPCGFWKKEFQKRGAIHWDWYGDKPEGVETSEVRAWACETWHRLVGQGEEAHLYYGASVSDWVGSPLEYVLKETFAASKEYQNIPPAGFHVGRWWGFTGGMAPVWEGVELSWRQGVSVRRLMRGYLKSKGYRSAIRSGVQGVWAKMLPETRRRMVEWVATQE